ncbi:hypothetical protein B7494_g4701 [Chlorociboria aeruginascens]|nr:hypothetical protein B7494_g4701 [Chlorociboria aeruginascens]
MPAIHSASVEARDGSASSYGAQGETPASSRHSTFSVHAHRPRHPANPPRGPSVATGNRRLNAPNHVAQSLEANSYSHNETTITGQTGTAEPQTVDEDYLDHESGSYYHLTPRYDDEIPTYDNHLVLEGEQTDDTVPPPSYQESVVNPDNVTQEANGTHSPTTQREVMNTKLFINKYTASTPSAHHSRTEQL